MSNSITLDSLFNSFLSAESTIEKQASAQVEIVKEAGLEELLSQDLQTRNAFKDGESLGRELMMKAASESLSQNLQDSDMNKVAQARVDSLVQFAMAKLAGEGDTNTVDGIVPGTVPMKPMADNAVLVAEQAASELPNAQGTVTEMQDELVQRALAQGAVNLSVNAGQDAAGERKDPQVEQVKAAAAIQALVGAGYDLDKAIAMVKAAGEGDINTQDGIASGSVPTKPTADNAAMVAEQAASELPNPQGTVTQLQDELVSRAVQQGAVATSVNAGQDAGGERKDPQVEMADAQEKAAAVMSLVGDGFDFDSAVALVKQAEEDLASEQYELQKAAAIQTLMSQYGATVEDAVAMVKQAEEEMYSEYAELEKAAAIQELVGEGYSVEDAVALVKQASEADPSFTEASELEKAAAVQELVAQGIDIDSAVALVKQAESERTPNRLRAFGRGYLEGSVAQTAVLGAAGGVAAARKEALNMARRPNTFTQGGAPGLGGFKSKAMGYARKAGQSNVVQKALRSNAAGEFAKMRSPGLSKTLTQAIKGVGTSNSLMLKRQIPGVIGTAGLVHGYVASRRNQLAAKHNKQ